MPAVSRYGSTKRFGSRYGRKVKYKLGKIEEERKHSKQCPYCHQPKIKRIALGIWQCRKCNSKFAGKAYSTGEKIVTTEKLFEKEPEEEKKAEEAA
jgi:large subunit ribosomal protein L37Ae